MRGTHVSQPIPFDSYELTEKKVCYSYAFYGYVLCRMFSLDN